MTNHTVTSTPYEIEDHRDKPIPDYWCYIHRAIETPSDKDACVECFECWHVYADTADVERVNHEQWGDNRPWEEIYSCPLCSHDW